jgi:hypothetical protein
MTEKKKTTKIEKTEEPEAQEFKGSVFVSMTEGGASASKIKTTHELYMDKDISKDS